MDDRILACDGAVHIRILPYVAKNSPDILLRIPPGKLSGPVAIQVEHRDLVAAPEAFLYHGDSNIAVAACDGNFHLKVSPRNAGGVGFDLGGCAFCHDHAAFAAAFGAHVDDPVGAFYDVRVVLYDDDSVLLVHQFFDYLEEGVDVGAVEARGGFVHDVDVAFLLQLRGYLEALGFAAGKGAQGLAELEVAKAYVLEEPQVLVDLWGGEEGECFIHGEVEDVGYVLALVPVGEDFGVVALSFAFIALGFY